MIPDEESLRYILLNVWKDLLARKKNDSLTKFDDLSEPISDLLSTLVNVIDILIRVLQDQLEDVRAELETVSKENYQMKRILASLMPDSKAIKDSSEPVKPISKSVTMKEYQLPITKPPSPSDAEIYSSLEEASKLMGVDPSELATDDSFSSLGKSPPPPPPSSQIAPPPPPPSSSQQSTTNSVPATDSTVESAVQTPEAIPNKSMLEELAQFTFQSVPQTNTPPKSFNPPATTSIRSQMMNELKKRFKEESSDSTD
ncbi:MAG: hypothetical protein ACFFC7_19840 [Candidatus Hermodarchaeota archaeon]